MMKGRVAPFPSWLADSKMIDSASDLGRIAHGSWLRGPGQNEVARPIFRVPRRGWCGRLHTPCSGRVSHPALVCVAHFSSTARTAFQYRQEAVCASIRKT